MNVWVIQFSDGVNEVVVTDRTVMDAIVLACNYREQMLESVVTVSRKVTHGTSHIYH